jgi:hypothetical protein
LAVSGSVTLDGILNVSLINSFNPAIGDNFTILTFATRAGDFATKNGLNIGGGKQLDANYGATDLTLSTVAAPPTPMPDNGPGSTDFYNAGRTARLMAAKQVAADELDRI